MNAVLGSPKTTTLGILTILAALVHAAVQYESKQPMDTTTLFAGVSAGIGLIMAKDASTHSTVEQIQKATDGARAEAARQ